MNRLMVVLALAACGGNSNQRPPDAAVTIDSRPIDSRPIDSRAIDAPPDSRPVDAPVVLIDAPVLDAPPAVCNPLTQTGCNTGEKCTWLVDAYTPQYVGHIGCAPNGTAAVDAACQFGAAGATGYDNCLAGTVCSNYQGGAGVCRSICDNQGGNPMCDASHGCVVKSNLFTTGSIAAAGVCDPSCDPLADNDFDGSGSALTRTGTTCGSAMIGCYGVPSSRPPGTVFTCQSDINYATPLHHRTVCDMTNGCEDASGSLFVNSCNQGYLPLLYESTGTTSVVCVAMCKPATCYAGNCGASNVNQHGTAPHRCENPDALGTFNVAAGGEECAYWWYLETDSSTGALQRSPYSDTLGFCLDHSKYLYDSNNDGTPDTALPACQQLQITATGTDPTMPLTYFGAKDLGCVDSATAGLFSGKQSKPALTGLRAPYHRAMR